MSHCCTRRSAKITCAAVTASLLLSLSITLLVFLFAYQHAPPHTPCAGTGTLGPITYLHRGNLNFAQENTFDAIVTGSITADAAAGEEGEGPANMEIDLSTLADGSVVLYHDKTIDRMTGIEGKTIAQIGSVADLPAILPEIDGYDYSTPNIIPEMKPVVEALCNLTPSIGIDFDTKVLDAVDASVDALMNSNCIKSIDSGGGAAGTAQADDSLVSQSASSTIWSTPYPGLASAIRRALDNAGLKDHRVGIYMPPGEYSFLGLRFMLHTRLLQAVFSTGSSILILHKSVFDEEEDGLIQSWRDDGWCTGIYGITPDEIDLYTADCYIVDEGPIFPNLPFGGYGADDDAPTETVFEDNSLASFRWLVVVACLFLVVSVGLFFMVVKWFRAADNIASDTMTVPGQEVPKKVVVNEDDEVDDDEREIGEEEERHQDEEKAAVSPST